MIRMAMAVLFVTLLVVEADARPRWRPGILRSRSTAASARVSNRSWSGGPQEVATAKAERAAALGFKGHLGGGFGGGNAEGFGFSTTSAQHALNNCCFTGQRPVAGAAVARGRDGWYAVKIYY